MRPLSAAALLLPLAVAASASAAPHVTPPTNPAAPVGDAPLPGYWRYETSFLFSNDSDLRCIGPADIDKVLRGPANRHYDCTYPVREVAGGRARFEGTCVSHKTGQRAAVSLSGTYGPAAFDFRGVVKPDLGGLSLPLNASISAHRMSATCPAG